MHKQTLQAVQLPVCTCLDTRYVGSSKGGGNMLLPLLLLSSKGGGGVLLPLLLLLLLRLPRLLH